MLLCDSALPLPGVPFSFPCSAWCSFSRSLLPCGSMPERCLFSLSSLGAAAEEGRRSQAGSPAWRTAGRQPPEGPPRSGPWPPAVLPPSAPLSHLRPAFLTVCCPAAWTLRAEAPALLLAIQGLPSTNAAQAGPGPCTPFAGTSPVPRTGPFPPASLPS